MRSDERILYALDGILYIYTDLESKQHHYVVSEYLTPSKALELLADWGETQLVRGFNGETTHWRNY